MSEQRYDRQLGYSNLSPREQRVKDIQKNTALMAGGVLMASIAAVGWIVNVGIGQIPLATVVCAPVIVEGVRSAAKALNRIRHPGK